MGSVLTFDTKSLAFLPEVFRDGQFEWRRRSANRFSSSETKLPRDQFTSALRVNASGVTLSGVVNES
jgi:hypothetical protein